MATYRVDRNAGPGDSPVPFRGVLLCECCFEAIGAVRSVAPFGGISARLVAALWPELRDPVSQHEELCHAHAGMRGRE